MIKTTRDKQEKYNSRFLRGMRKFFDKNPIFISILLSADYFIDVGKQHIS